MAMKSGELYSLVGVKPSDIIYAYDKDTIVAYKVINHYHYLENVNGQNVIRDKLIALSALTHKEEIIDLSNDFFRNVNDCILQQNAIKKEYLNKHKILECLRSQGYETSMDIHGNVVVIFYYMELGKIDKKVFELAYSRTISVVYNDEHDITLQLSYPVGVSYFKSASECAKHNDFKICTF